MSGDGLDQVGGAVLREGEGQDGAQQRLGWGEVAGALEGRR